MGGAGGGGGGGHDTVKILLNRGSVQSYEQLLRDISEAFGPRWRASKVQRLFTLRGRQLRSAADFFREDDVFVAGVGGEAPGRDEMKGLLAALYPQSSHARSLLRQWDRAQKRRDGKNRQLDGGKRDSGLGSDDGAENTRGRRGGAAEEGGRRKWGGGGETPGARSGAKGTSDDALRLERERLRAAEEERERAHEALRARQDSERRGLREQRRNLVPARPEPEPAQRRRPRRRVFQPQSPASNGGGGETKYIIVVKGDEGGAQKGDGMEGATPGRESGRNTRLGRNREARGKRDDEAEKENVDGRKAGRGDGKGEVGWKEEEGRERNAGKGGSEGGKAGEGAGKGTAAAGEKKKPAAKVVYRTKTERQVPNADHILDKYQLGKILGDGNFAVVKQVSTLLRHCMLTTPR